MIGKNYFFNMLFRVPCQNGKNGTSKMRLPLAVRPSVHSIISVTNATLRAVNMCLEEQLELQTRKRFKDAFPELNTSL